jgi:photoactive yellow protein
MRIHLPVTQREFDLGANVSSISTTDTRSRLTYRAHQGGLTAPTREIDCLSEPRTVDFDQAMVAGLQALDDGLDLLAFGVIGFDADTLVRCYNARESRLAGLSPQRVLGHPLFTEVAPCMNNFMVAQRFEDALAAGVALDATIDYMLTLRMRPVQVKLRLLSVPGVAMRYVLILRPGS